MADEMLDEFVHEAGEHLANAVQHLLRLARMPTPEAEVVNACFRCLHTVKGCAGFLDLPRIRELAHTAEQVLDAVRSGEITPSAGTWDVLLGAVTRLEERITALQADPKEMAGDDAEFLLALDSALPGHPDPEQVAVAVSAVTSRIHVKLTSADQAPTPATVPVTAATIRIDPKSDPQQILDFISESQELLSEAEAVVVNRDQLVIADANHVFRCFHTIKGMAAYLGQQGIETAAHAIEDQLLPARDGTAPADAGFIATVLIGIDQIRTLLSERAASPRIGDALVGLGVPRAAVEAVAAALPAGKRLGDAMVETGVVARPVVEQAAKVVQDSQAVAAKAKAGDGYSRVSTAKLEEMVTTVGELLIAQAMVVHDPALAGLPSLHMAVQRQSRLLRALQVLALGMRMVPMRGTFQKMARAIHDTARKLGKTVEFQSFGDDTEIDRTLAEAMADPLLHMVRNAVDHGIESAEVRRQRGKSEVGQVMLTAWNAGDDVVVTLSDDGGGMDPQKLRASAVAKGLIPADRQLTDAECFDLIFAPGFSTAAAVTDVSGRGVGMDVVRRQVTQANGSVTIESTVGRGSTFTIRLPLTTAILDAMLLCCGEDRFLLPVASVVSMVRPAEGEVESILGTGQILRFRGGTIPVVALGAMFAIPGHRRDPRTAMLVVIEHRSRHMAVQVDDVIGQRQVVIKPLDRGIHHHPGVSGCAILGDGRVALILDPAHLSQHGP